MGNLLDSAAWQQAPEADRMRALVTATRVVDMQPLRGRRKEPGQPLGFPRLVWSGSAWCPYDEAPAEVRAAVCEEALARLAQTDWERQRQRMQQMGVSHVSIAEGATEIAVQEHVLDQARGGEQLLSPRARSLLRPWVMPGGRLV